MLSQHEIMQTIQMIDQQHLDVRTITMGISLLSCARSDPKAACNAIYDKITRYAEKLVATGEAIEAEFGIPIVNKRISVTPIALVAAAAETDDYAPFAAALDRAAKAAAPQAEESAESDPEIDALVAARTQAKKDKNWAEADRIRDELKARGIELIDTKEGTKWKRV